MEARDASEHLAVARTAPMTNNYMALSLSSARVEVGKPWCGSSVLSQDWLPLKEAKETGLSYMEKSLV